MISGINRDLLNTVDAGKNSDLLSQKVEGAINKKDDQKLKAVCQEFESVFLNMLFKQMKNSIPKSELIKEDNGRKIFESMLDEKLMESASKTNSFGLADMMYKQFLRLQQDQ